MGKIRDIFSRIIEPAGSDLPAGFSAGWNYNEYGELNIPIAQAAAIAKNANSVIGVWSLNRFKENAGDSAKEEWDELEKSVIANIADDVEIGISGNTVEMVVYKKM